MMYGIGDKVILARDGAGIHDGYGQEYEVVDLMPRGLDTYRIQNENHRWWCYEHQLDSAYTLPEVSPNLNALDKLIGGV